MNGRARKFRHAPLIALVVVLLLAGGGMVWLVRSYLKTAPPATKPLAQEIHIIRPPPPPPDTPPPPPPPEEKVDVHEPEQQPDPTPSDEPPPSEQLGLDAEGGAGGDAFGLVGHQGGRDLLASGGSAYAYYGGLVKNEIVQQLEADKQARGAQYSVVVRIWIGPDGSVERVHISQSSGDRERDRVIEAALSRIARISQAPPADMPQPISLRIVSRA